MPRVANNIERQFERAGLDESPRVVGSFNPVRALTEDIKRITGRAFCLRDVVDLNGVGLDAEPNRLGRCLDNNGRPRRFDLFYPHIGLAVDFRKRYLHEIQVKSKWALDKKITYLYLKPGDRETYQRFLEIVESQWGTPEIEVLA